MIFKNLALGKKKILFEFFGIVILVLGLGLINAEKVQAVPRGGVCLVDDDCDNPCDECDWTFHCVVGGIPSTPVVAAAGFPLCKDFLTPWTVCSGGNVRFAEQQCVGGLLGRSCQLNDPVSWTTCTGATPNCVQVGSPVTGSASCQGGGGGGGCIASAPTISSVNPASYTGPAGLKTFTFGVTRGDTGCGASATIPLSITCSGATTNWSSGSPSTTALAPGATDSGRSVDVTITATGSCTITAKSPSNNALTSTKTFDYTVSANALTVTSTITNTTAGTSITPIFTVTAGGSPVDPMTVTLSGGFSGSCITGFQPGKCSAGIINASSNITVIASDPNGVYSSSAPIIITITGGGPGACASKSCGASNPPGCTCGTATTTAGTPWCCAANPSGASGTFGSGGVCNTFCTGGGGPGPVCVPATCAGGCADGTPCAGGGTCTLGACVVGGGGGGGGGGGSPCGGPGMYISPLSAGYCTIEEILTNATNWILALVSSIIILVIIIGGLMYISSSGDEEKLRTSKNIIFYAIIGLAIILISYAVITEVTNILKGP